MDQDIIPLPLWARVAVQVSLTAAVVGGPVVYKAAQLEQQVEFTRIQLAELKDEFKLLRRDLHR
mgnify:CR=1 FL=1